MNFTENIHSWSSITFPQSDNAMHRLKNKL